MGISRLPVSTADTDEQLSRTGPRNAAAADTTTPTSSRRRSLRRLPARIAAVAWTAPHAALQTLLGQRPLAPSPDGRHIPLRPAATSAADAPALVDVRRRGAGRPYINNSIRTSRYTLWDFFPKQLFFQFSRLHNFYFLLTSIFMILGWGSVGKFTAILPLMFFVALTIAKEGWDDFRRHRLDSVENATPVAVLGCERPEAAGWRERMRSRRRRNASSEASSNADESKTAETRVKNVDDEAKGGDGRPPFGVRVSDEEHAGRCWVRRRWLEVRVGDIIRLARDDPVPADIVILDASGPNRSAYVETMALDGETNLKPRFVCPLLPPLSTVEQLLALDADVVAEDPNPDLYRFEGRLTVGGETRPLTTGEVAYRGSIVRNTDMVVGLVVNTGEECKMRMNANQHPQAKRPALESAVNVLVLMLVGFVVLLSGGFTVGYRRFHAGYERNAWYLDGATVPLHHIIFGFVILFNSIVPLSLYVTLEMIKLGQMLLLNWDVDMYDAASDTPARCNTNTILENLGQVGYVFSDKTGTLTENVMKFRKMSVAGTVWHHDDVKAVSVDGGAVASSAVASGALSVPPPSPHAVASFNMTARATPSLATSPDPRKPLPIITTGVIPEEDDHPASPFVHEPAADAPTADLVEYMRQRPHTKFARRAREYVMALALCHTCLPEVVDGRIQYQASSPDELALVDAARELGVTLVERTAESVTLEVDGGGERLTFGVLDVVEFSSKRKRMTVVVRRPDGRIEVICKGADSVVLPRLRMSDEAQRRARETRASVEAERELFRRSDQIEMRSSLTLRRLSGNYAPSHHHHHHLAAAAGSPSLASPAARQSFEVSKLRRSADLMHSPVAPRFSLDQWPGSPTSRSAAGLRHHRFSATTPTAPAHHDRFAHLEDPRLVDDDAAVFDRCFRHLDGFATAGLRTLVYARKTISADDYAAWKATFVAATTSLVDRQEKIEAAAELLEHGLELVGASAIEDKLQRGVPETIDKLRRAGIKVWMLTGDKRETAVNIAHAAGICRPASDVYVLDSTKNAPLADQLGGLADDLASGTVVHSVAVIDGHTLGLLEKSPMLLRTFFAIVPHVDSVICCRASPAQKALLVRGVRARLGTSRGLTLAIGDGANDLAMIEASHVGVGISGNEGLQAARVADYAVAQFRFLQRLLLVHGRWNYVRTTRFILATFWKELFFYIPTALFQLTNGFSGTSLYHETSLTVFNTLFTSLCVLVPGITEQDLRAETLLALPELYVYGQRGRGMDVVRCAGWIANGVVYAVLMWFVVQAGLRAGPESPSFGDQGLYAMGTAIFTIAVVWINFKLLILDMHYKSWLVAATFGVTVVGWFCWVVLLDGVYGAGVSPYAVRHSFTRVFGRDLNWWTTVGACLAMLAICEVAWKVALGWFRRRGCEDGFDRLLSEDGVMGSGSPGGVFRGSGFENGGIFVIDEITESMATTPDDDFSASFGGAKDLARSPTTGAPSQRAMSAKHVKARLGRKLRRCGVDGGMGLWEPGVWQELERAGEVRRRLGEIVKMDDGELCVDGGGEHRD